MSLRATLREFPETFRLAIPISLGMLSHMLIQLTDTLLLGHYGTAELAASAFAGSIVMLILYMGLGFGQAISVLSSRFLGAGNPRHARNIYSIASWEGFIFACLGVLFTLAILPTFDVMGQPPLVVALSKPFAILIAISFIPTILFQNLRNYYESLKRPWIPFASMIILLVLNIFFNWILIFGCFGLPAMGIIGSGLGTLLARGITFLVLFGFAHIAGQPLAGKYIVERPVTNSWLPWQDFWNILKIAFTGGAQIVISMLAYVVGGIWIGTLGTEAIAANRIVGIIDNLIYMIPLGIGSALCVRVAHAHGEGNLVKVLNIYRSGFFITLIFCALISASLILFGDTLTGGFTQDGQTLSIARHLILIAAIFCPFDNLTGITLNALRGIGDILTPATLYLGIYWLVAIPLVYAFIFNFHWGAAGGWWGYCIGIILSSIVLFGRFLAKTKSKSMESF